MNTNKVNEFLNNGHKPQIDFKNTISSIISHEIGHDLDIDHSKEGVGSRDNRGSNSNVTNDEVGAMVHTAFENNKINK